MESIEHVKRTQETLQILQDHPDIKKDPKMSALVSQAIAELEQAKLMMNNKPSSEPKFKVERKEKGEFGQR